MKLFFSIPILLTIIIFSCMGITSAAEYSPVNPDDQGMIGIVGNDTLIFSNNTIWANLTAYWGVRVIFQDYDGTTLQNELLTVTDDTTANTTTPSDPARTGYTFTGWERVDTEDGPATLNEDGTVTGINGPGPIVYRAQYESLDFYVTYTVDGDQTYGSPADVTVPEDENNPYDYNATVTVKEDLTTSQTYAEVNGEQIPGTWTFTSWDTDDFRITEDTVITGSWTFTPDAESGYIIRADSSI